MKKQSPVHFLVFFVLSSSSFLVAFSAPSLPLQLQSLISIKSSLQDPLNSFHDWDPTPFFSSSSPQVWCSWSGVKCNLGTGEITSLNLSHRNLSGVIPDGIRHLTSLIHLNLSSNAFDGAFPPTIFELAELRTLDINHNNFNSTFPPGISKLKFLKVFNAFSNSFTGPLPKEFASLRYLEELNLGGSYFGGEIPEAYGNFLRLKFLHLAGNLLEGTLPPKLGFLAQLERMEIGYNFFLRGQIPKQFSMLNNLQYLDISNCSLSGNLTQELGSLTKLENLLLFKNQLTGEIPGSFTSLTSLKALDLSDNRLFGRIPEGLSSLKELTRLSLMKNNLTGEIPEAIATLSNLDTLLLWANSLTGILPRNLGSNGKLQWLDVSSNSLTGPIPPNLCKGNRLFKLILFSNKFLGALPAPLANCTSLTRLRIQDNRLNGSIPSGFGQLPNLNFADLSKNNFLGEIPRDIGNGPQLQYLNISENSFESSLPGDIWSARSLQIFSAASSRIIGKIPEFIGCSSLYKIELQDNLLNSSIPRDIGNCQKLISLNLSRNSFTGIIPSEICQIPSIAAVDLSHNLLTGTIPSQFENCTTLETFNVSYNLLTGPIPASGSVFSNLHPSSFSGNQGLCGDVLARPCDADALSAGNAESHRRQWPRKTTGAIVWIMAAAIGIGLFVLAAATRCFHSNYSRGFRNESEIGPWKLTAFQRLNFTADDLLECVSTSDKIVGMGSTGTVYRAEMPGGEIIAVKKLWGKQKEYIRRRRGVVAEVDVLGNVRHRNIVRLLGCCSNRECTMLLYEYMPNGNLEDLLHGKKKGENLVADWVTRYKIALGVAQGICYLHHDCDPVIVHRDLKPSNILLDGQMEARVADFGVAKLIQSDECMSVIAGSYGYIAPEYAYTLQVDEKSDIYSYGVVLMEIISGKRSVDAEFGDGNSIVDWVRSKLRAKDGLHDILDKNAGASIVSVREEMTQMLRIALLCTSRNPADRPCMRDVVLMLQEAKPKRKLPGSVIGGGGGGDSLLTAKDVVVAEKPAAEC